MKGTIVIEFKNKKGEVTDSYEFGDDTPIESAQAEAKLLHEAKKTLKVKTTVTLND